MCALQFAAQVEQKQIDTVAVDKKFIRQIATNQRIIE
jgi:hypothetical protein